jgi:hypothetical protein
MAVGISLQALLVGLVAVHLEELVVYGMIRNLYHAGLVARKTPPGGPRGRGAGL